MYRTPNLYQLEFEDFYLPFGGKLRSDNRWIILSKQIPWQEIEQQYPALFADSSTGNPAKSARIAIEGKFGQGKRCFSLDRIMAKLAETSEAVIMVSFIVMNLEKILSGILFFVPNIFFPVWMALRWVGWRTCNRMQWELRFCPGDVKIC